MMMRVMMMMRAMRMLMNVDDNDGRCMMNDAC
jgi:hypothetical protein